MRVWINTPEGWVQHGGARKSAERAAIVAKLLATRCGWETASGPEPPPDRPAMPGAPSAATAAVSPAPCAHGPRAGATHQVDGTFPTERVEDTRRDTPAGSLVEEEPYLDELASFALEAQLRDFIIGNISRVPIKETRLHLYRDSSGRLGKEYPTAVGPIDILAVDKGGNFFVFELKLGRGADRVLGQLARYMGWVKTNLARDTEVNGVVVAQTIDEKLRYAARVMSRITLLEYEVDFRVREVS
jgi:hypothetical protein